MGTPSGLAGVGGDQSFADRAGPVLLGDRVPAGAQSSPTRRSAGAMTRSHRSISSTLPASLRKPVPGPGLMGDRRVEAPRLGRPVTDVNGPGRFLAEAAPGRERRDVALADGVAAAHLAGLGRMPWRTQA